MRRALLVLFVLIGLALLAALVVVRFGGRPASTPAPPRVDTPAPLPAESSTLVVPVAAPLAELEAALDRALPRRLWAIDQRIERCIPAQRVNLGIGRLRVTPDLGCHVVGGVTRGAVRLSGSGDRLIIALPVRAAIAARNVGGLVSKTATGAATVHAVARLSIAGDWQPRARIAIKYQWTTEPGIDLLGRRISFVDKADQRLRPIVAQLERTLPQELAKLRVRDRLADAWRHGFTVVQLNRDNPPAWMRVSPRRLGFGGYRVQGRTLELTLAAEALTETFVGPRPADPARIPLPPPSPLPTARGLRFFLPVVADYRQLEPVVARALVKRAQRGITLTGVGPVDASFGTVTIYPTLGGRLAIGIDAKARARENAMLSASGRIWLTALPFNRPGSQRIEARDVRLAADTDSRVANLLVRVLDDTSVRESIAQGLRHDFAGEYARVLGKARAAIARRQEGDFGVSAQVTRVETGQLRVTGQGLFLPVRASGAATIRFRPR